MRLFLTAFILAVIALLAVAPRSPAAPGETRGQARARGAHDEMSAALYYNRAQNTIKKGAYGEALEAVIEGTRIDPSYPPFLWQKALVLTRLKQHEEARQALELAMLTM
ncbi:MAG: hypothetical protein FWF99_07690, partial [Desulfovibrionaceae bacterium]|nr:hypothetical protein [Desulfovibrionaceae bacterium]